MNKELDNKLKLVSGIRGMEVEIAVEFVERLPKELCLSSKRCGFNRYTNELMDKLNEEEYRLRYKTK